MPPRRQVLPPVEAPKRPTRGKAPAKNSVVKTKRATKVPAGKKATEGNPRQKPEGTRAVVGKPKTLMERILFIVQGATSLVGLPTLKKRLIDEFGLTDSPTFRKNVAKALATLSESGRSDFGKIGGSYHGGEASEAYLAHKEAQDTAQEAAEEDEKMKDSGCTKCCWCDQWCDDDCCLGEDSIARGSKYKCVHCDRIYWTWISDGYVYGHPVEYKKGSDYA
ncbi:Aste57867_9954 [Aphanomyces stellatus]|uniref:Aste57867_9954 protein n=1 Tax=Aphanomyces stellatus TaxID=120398 RepID=A0A485KP56_9STRA|nr:hypothetical protein As57867_009915 [Aphanomyces stellatus]VFT86832.1 Aste57867_9954 [Aphanomyces stellatus]